MATKEVNEKKKIFAQEYAKTFNGTDSAVKAGYSKKSAHAAASRLLNDVKVREHLTKLYAKAEAKTDITLEKVIKELAKIAFHNTKDLAQFTIDGIHFEDWSKLSDDKTACVSSVTEHMTANGGSRSFRTYDKVKALELLGKHLGLKQQLDVDMTVRPTTRIKRFGSDVVVELSMEKEEND